MHPTARGAPELSPILLPKAVLFPLGGLIKGSIQFGSSAAIASRKVAGKARTKETVQIESKPNNKEEAQVEIILVKEKETPGTWRFKEKKEDHPMTIYLTKEQVKELGSPESIKITIEAA